MAERTCSIMGNHRKLKNDTHLLRWNRRNMVLLQHRYQNSNRKFHQATVLDFQDKPVYRFGRSVHSGAIDHLIEDNGF